MPTYKSFLICFHERQIDVYISGLPIGKIVDGNIISHVRELPDGRKLKAEVDTDLLSRVEEVVNQLKQ